MGNIKITVHKSIIFIFYYSYGNVFKAMKYKTHNPYKRTWKIFSERNKNIQDIVHRDYESNRT